MTAGHTQPRGRIDLLPQSVPLQCSLAPLVIADANRFIHARQKNLPITDLARARRAQDGLHCFFHHRVRQNQLQLGLRDKVHAVLPAAVNLGVALLSPMPPHLEHGHALHANLLQRALHRFQLGVLDDRFNLRHDVVPRFGLAIELRANTTRPALTLSSAATPRKLKLFIAPIRICYARVAPACSFRRTLLPSRSRWRLGKLRIVHGNALLNLAHLNREPSPRARQRPAERNLHRARLTVVGIIDLRGHLSERRLSISNQPHQQSGLLVKIQPQRWLSVTLPNHQVSIVVTHLLRASHLRFAEHLLQVRRKVKIRIHRCRVQLLPMHLSRRPARSPQPALVAVECGHTVSVGRVPERYPLVRILRVDVDRNIPVAESDRALHHTAGNLSDRGGSAHCLQIFVEHLIRSWTACFRLFPILFIGLLGFYHTRFRFFRHHQRCPHRLDAAAVARIAGHFAMSPEVILINGKHHLHHFPCRLLRLLVVLLERALHVAKFAAHAQRGGNELHPRNQLIRRNALQDLDILELLLSLLGFGWVSSRGSARLRLRAAHQHSAHCQGSDHPYYRYFPFH